MKHIRKIIPKRRSWRLIVISSLVAITLLIIGLFFLLKKNDLPKIVKNTEITISGNGDVEICESIELDPGVDVHLISLAFLTPNTATLSNVEINHFPKSANTFIADKQKLRSKNYIFFSTPNFISNYTDISNGTLISWVIKYNFATKYQKTLFDSLPSMNLHFYKPILNISKRAIIHENVHVKIRDKRYLIESFGLPNRSNATNIFPTKIMYINEYEQKPEIEGRIGRAVDEPSIVLHSIKYSVDIIEKRTNINILHPDQIQVSYITSFFNLPKKTFVFELETNEKLDLTDPEIKIFIEGKQPTVIPIEEELLEEIRERKFIDTKSFSYYYGSKLLPIDSNPNKKSIILIIPQNESNYVKTAIDIFYNPQQVNEIIKIDEFHYKFIKNNYYAPGLKNDNDIVEVNLPNEYKFTGNNYSDKIINHSENKLVFKSLNKFDFITKPLVIYFSDKNIDTLNTIRLVNIILAIVTLLTILFSLSKSMTISMIFKLSGGIIASFMSIIAGLFNSELFVQSLLYTRFYLPFIPLAVPFFIWLVNFIKQRKSSRNY